MRLLVLGGTRFVGRAVVDEAISRGYDVTTFFSRGLSGHPRPGAEALHGDRTSSGDLRQLDQRDWDAVIDTSVIAPVHVRASARLLAGRVSHYTYVSTACVYAGQPALPVSEDSPVRECPADADGTVETLGYGELKAGCERAVAEAMPGRNLIVRPGVIVGPHEDAGRLPWWLARMARGGPVLAPGAPGRPVRLTDVRDFAAWLVDNTRRGICAAVNVPGRDDTTFGDLLADCAAATARDRAAPPDLRWVDDQSLLTAGVRPWSELPLWVPGIPELAGIWEVSGARALRTGMRYRPLADTVADTWHWLRQEAAATGGTVSGIERRPGIGLDPGRERDLLASL